MTKSAPRPNFYRMTIAEFRRSAFVGKAPCAATIRTAIDKKSWAGERVNGLYFIFVDETGQPFPGAPETPSTGNAAADALIMEWNSSRT